MEYAVAGASVASRAAGYDMPGIVADGQSALDMYEVAGEAIRRARAGQGPTLIEAQTYRYQGHFGADNTLLYREQEEEDYYKARDCNENLKVYLLDNGVATEAELEEMDRRAVADIAKAARFAEDSPFPGPEELETDVYVSYP
jgi:pyruvate dehydrogenase E1 component alpha subunit